MKTFLIILLLFNPFFCDCDYKGHLSKVQMDENGKSFTPIMMALGEDIIYAEFSDCSHNRKTIYLRGRVHDRSTFVDYSKSLDKEVEIYRCNASGTIVEKIMTTKKIGFFDFIIDRDKKGFIVFKEKNKREGTKYAIKAFK